MRNNLYKIMPFVFGGILGWLLSNPPGWLDSLGIWGEAVNLVFVGLLLLSMVAVVLVTGLPAKLTLEPIEDHDVPPELRALADQFQRLGFRPAGPAHRVHIAPAATLVTLVHASEPIYGNVFRTGTIPPKVERDFVSVLEGDAGALTTNAEPAGAALPAGDGGLRQVFPGESLEGLLEQHREGVRYLRERGIECRAVSADTLPQDLRSSMARQRERVMSSPIRSTVVTLWRAATRRIPFTGALREQRIARRQIGRILARQNRGRSTRPLDHG
jgi:hypothetical protein